MKFVIKEEVDMLITGHHRLLPSEHHAYTKAMRKRVAIGKEVIARRKEMARVLNKHMGNKNIIEKGRIIE